MISTFTINTLKFVTSSWSYIFFLISFNLIVCYLISKYLLKSKKRVFELHILIQANNKQLLAALEDWHEKNIDYLKSLGYEASRVMETSTKVGDFPNQPMLTCVVYTTSHREAIKLRKKLSNILENALKEKMARGKTEEVLARGKTEEVLARGKTEEVLARGKTEEVLARGKTEEVLARGKTEEVLARGKTEEELIEGKMRKYLGDKTDVLLAEWRKIF